MKKKLNEIFDEAKPEELDQFSDELKAPELSPEVLASVKGKVYAKTKLKKEKKNNKNVWLRFGAIAACFLLIVSVIIAVPMLREGDPGVIPGPGTDSGVETGNGTNVGDTSGDEMADWAFYAYINDSQFENYRLSEHGFFCDPENIGEHIGEITIAVSFGPNNATDVTADVYKVEGVDSDLCLCIRYRDDGTEEFYHDFLVYDAYYFIYAKTYQFASYNDMLDLILDENSIRLPNNWNYNNESDIKYFLNQNVLDELKPLLITIDGDGVDTQDGKVLDQVNTEATEFVSTSCSFEGKFGYITGQIRIYNNGYLYHSGFGGQLFEIGQENARKIIDYVVTNGVTESYEWIERDGKWYPIIYDEDAEYSNFVNALYESKLWGQIYFADSVTHWEQVYGNEYHETTLSRKALDSLAQILSDSVNILSEDEGRAVENSEIPGFSADEMLFNPVEAVVLTHNWDVNGESTCVISVYDSGHVQLNGVYYYIGTNITDRIFETVHFECCNPAN